MSAREERLAGNEALFREVNERVAEVATKFIEVEVQTEKVDFTCECGRADCSEPTHLRNVSLGHFLVRVEALEPRLGRPKLWTLLR